MYRDNERYKTFSRRTIILFGGKVVLFSGLIGRMYYLQVIEGEKYKTLSDENRISLKLISPKRGRILDRSGRPMAINQKTNLLESKKGNCQRQNNIQIGTA